MKSNKEPELPQDNPFPSDFSNALIVSRDEEKLSSLRPFTQRWKDNWAKLAKKNGASNSLQSFDDANGLELLKSLTDRGANPNFILLLLVRYLWREDTDIPEHKDPYIKTYKGLLQSVRDTHFYYQEFYKKPSLPAYEYRKLIPRGGEPNEDVERFLCTAEEDISRFLKSKDFQPPGLRHPPNERVNRVVFTIYEHLKYTTGGPQWRIFLELLVVSGALKRGVKKKRENKEETTDNPDSRISTHIRSFQKYHPGEAHSIKFLATRPVI